ncbi:MAG: hypothetical protein HOY79_47075 [Streptomyces sp.]|nr:hypothetical protein [Streptomyces sp.]
MPSPDGAEQDRIRAALHAAAELLGAEIDMPTQLSRSEQITHLTGVLLALCDDVSANAGLYESGDLYPIGAAASYVDTCAALNTGRSRCAIGLRLLQYAAVLQPPGLTAVTDPVTPAAVHAMQFAATMLAAQTVPADVLPRCLAAASDDLAAASGWLAQVYAAVGIPARSDDAGRASR